MSRSDKNLYKVKATMMIPLEVEVLMRADSPKDAKRTTDCLRGMDGRWEDEIILNKDMYNQYEIESYEQVLKETINDLDWSVEVDFDKEPVKACCLCYEPLEVMKDENGEVTSILAQMPESIQKELIKTDFLLPVEKEVCE